MNEVRLIDANALIKEFERLGYTYRVTSIIDNSPTVELFCHYQYDGEVKEPCVESPCSHERPKGDLWHPIKTRLLTDEEKAKLRENPNVDDDIIEEKFDCALPEDGQQVLITTKAWNQLAITTFHYDVDGCYFEDWEDTDEVAAWMPLPKPFGGDEND